MDSYMHQDDVFWLDISMKNFMFMHEANSIKQITNNKRSALLRQGLTS
jgi:hypothetical protein